MSLVATKRSSTCGLSREDTDLEVAERIEKFASACKSGVRGLRHKISDIYAPSSRLQFPRRPAKREFQRDRARIYCFGARAREMMIHKAARRRSHRLNRQPNRPSGLLRRRASGIGTSQSRILAIRVQKVILTTVLAQLFCLIISIRKLQM